MTHDVWAARLCRVEGHPSDWDDEIDTADDRREPRHRRAARHERAKGVCRRCPALEECFRRINPVLDSGIWAGVLLDRSTRRRLIRQQRRSGRRTA